MNLIRNFESRVRDAFGAAPQGYSAPFSFKRLAKAAAKQMEAETFVIDGVDTAPALYTILVSSVDDTAMRLLYPTLTEEIVTFVVAQATAKGYVFVGDPLARFLVDPSLRTGRFAVFAENVDAATLERLRAEERSFLLGASAVGGAAADRGGAHAASWPARRPASHVTPVVPVASDLDDDLAPVALADMPASPAPVAVASVAPVVPEALAAHVAATAEEAEAQVPLDDPFDALDDSSSMGLDVMPSDVLDDQVRASALSVPEVVPEAVPDPLAVPLTVRRTTPVDAPAAGTPVAEVAAPATCLLVDRQSGRTYVGTAPATAIGRERVPGGIVLADPNVSRRHAELTFENGQWLIRDLNSTNGTLVNDVDIAQCSLRDGDLVTIGLMNLEFREA